VTSGADPRPCFYLVGATGFPNYGDELIARGWLRYLAEVAPEADVWLDCHSPGPARTLLDGVHPRARFVDTLWRLCWDAPSDQPWEVASWVQDAVHDPGLAPRWAAGIELLGRADVVHLIGGGYVNELWPRHVGLLAGAVAATRRSGGRAASGRSGARAVMTGQGLTPEAPTSGPLLAALAERFDVVDVRDGPSAHLVGLGGQRPGVDDAFLDLGGHQFAPASQAPEVVLCLQSDLVAAGSARLACAVLGMLRAWAVDPAEVGVVEALPSGDREVYDLLRHQLPGARFVSFAQLWSQGVPARPGQTWISTRFHLHLLAAAAGASGVAVSVRPGYYATKHRSLLDLGTGWTLTEDLDAIPPRPTGTLDPAALAAAREDKRRVADSIYRTGCSAS
jgi:polysaccharide pyruvyl transferase WcaK-like protein